MTIEGDLKFCERFEKDFELSPVDAELLISTPALADYFESCVFKSLDYPA